MGKRLILFGMIAAVLLFVTGNAQAALLGLDLGLPDILSTRVTYAYDATTNLFTSSATPNEITFDDSTFIDITDITGDPYSIRSYSVSFKVDELGNFAGPKDDLVITGNFTYNNISYSGELVRGEVTNFGWENSSYYDRFDFTFDFTGGELSSFYAAYNNKGGDVMFSLESDKFTGDFTKSFSGTATTHNTAPVPEPTSLLLLGSGLLGLAAVGRKKRRI